MLTHSAMPPETRRPSTSYLPSGGGAPDGRRLTTQRRRIRSGSERPSAPARLDDVVKGQPASGDLLIGLMTLAGDDHHVPGPAASSARRMATRRSGSTTNVRARPRRPARRASTSR